MLFVGCLSLFIVKLFYVISIWPMTISMNKYCPSTFTTTISVTSYSLPSPTTLTITSLFIIWIAITCYLSPIVNADSLIITYSPIIMPLITAYWVVILLIALIGVILNCVTVILKI